MLYTGWETDLEKHVVDVVLEEVLHPVAQAEGHAQRRAQVQLLRCLIAGVVVWWLFVTMRLSIIGRKEARSAIDSKGKTGWHDNHPSSLPHLGPLLLRPGRVQPALDELGEEEVAEEELVLGHGAARDDEGERPLGLVVQHQGLCFCGIGWVEKRGVIDRMCMDTIHPTPTSYVPHRP